MYDDNDPEVIAAEAEAKKKVLEARSKLHPAAQTAYAFLDVLPKLGCLFIIFIAVIAIFAPQLFSYIFALLAN